MSRQLRSHYYGTPEYGLPDLPPGARWKIVDRPGSHVRFDRLLLTSGSVEMSANDWARQLSGTHGITVSDIYRRIVGLFWDASRSLSTHHGPWDGTRSKVERWTVDQEVPSVVRHFQAWASYRIRGTEGKMNTTDPKLISQVDTLAEIAGAEAVTNDPVKKMALLEEWATEAVRSKVVDPDRMEELFLHWLSPRDSRFPQRGSLRDICPTFVEIHEDLGGGDIKSAARKVRDLMVSAIRNGDDLDVYQAVGLCEELAARAKYRIDVP